MDSYGHGFAFVFRGRELILPDSFDGFGIESHAEVTNDADVFGPAIASDNHGQDADSLIMRFPRLF